MNSKAPSMNDRSYEDFQPVAHWVTEESKTLEIHLPDFRKEHIRVKLDNQGNLRISGERPLEENKWSRFVLNVRIPKDTNFNEIHAKFINNVLRVVLPKKIVPARLEDLPSEKIAKDQTEDQKKREEQIPDATEAKNPTNDIGGYVLKQQRNHRRALIVNVVVAIGVAVAAGAYVVYMLRNSLSQQNY